MEIHQKLKNKTLIIAEAGVNHNGDYDTAISLIDEASYAGADFIKFQTFKTEKIVSRNAKKANYQRKSTDEIDDSQYELLKKLEIPNEWYPRLIMRSKEKGIKFLSTGFDHESLNLLDKNKIPFFKIPSGEITNKPYLEYISKFKKDIILSTGLSTLAEIKKANDTQEIAKKFEELQFNACTSNQILIEYIFTSLGDFAKKIEFKINTDIKNLFEKIFVNLAPKPFLPPVIFFSSLS